MGAGALIFVIKITVLIALAIKSWAKAQPLQYGLSGGAEDGGWKNQPREFAVMK